MTLEVADLEAARRFYSAFGVDTYIRLRASEAHSTGFRGFTLALTVSGPTTVDLAISQLHQGDAEQACATTEDAFTLMSEKQSWGTASHRAARRPAGGPGRAHPQH